MQIQQKVNNRILIYFFYDGDGVADDYVIYNLKGFRPYMKKIVFVCNGKLTDESRVKIEKVTDKIIVRDNVGFDGWAYKAGIDGEGWKELETYDELIMTNHTIMGPVESYEDMFVTMDDRDLDFWGVTKNYQIDYDFFGCCEYGYIPEHIQTHFIAVRKSMISSEEFQKYWNHFPKIHNYAEAVGMHEAIFTKHFADFGYTWDVYINTDDIKDMCDYPLINMATTMLQRGCPFFKRRSFFQEYGHFLEQSIGTATMELMQYLKEHTSYDVNMIWDNILRSCNMEDITRCLQLNYIVDTQLSSPEKLAEVGKKRKVALLMHLYFEELFDEMYHYAESMPEYADVYLTVGDERKKKTLEEKFATLPVHKVEVILCENRGRDVSAGLIIGKRLMEQYDYVCFAHDKKVTQLKNGLTGQGFADRCFKNILYNKHLVANILQVFEENDRLGMLGTAFPNHGEYLQLYGSEWTVNFTNTKKLASDLGLHVPMDEKKMSICAYGSEFWFRTAALKKLYEKDWKYEDFPEEPLPTDATISHAIERVRPFVAQAAGYYSAMVMSDVYARVEYTNLSYYFRTYFKGMQRAEGSGESIMAQIQRQEEMQKYIHELEQRVTVKGFFKRIVARIFPFIKIKW